MAPPELVSKQTRHSRKSIAYQPHTNKEVSAPLPEAPAKISRKTRSKSLGPDGLDVENKKNALKDGAGNRVSVGRLFIDSKL
jgi:hypothetical protein